MGFEWGSAAPWVPTKDNYAHCSVLFAHRGSSGGRAARALVDLRTKHTPLNEIARVQEFIFRGRQTIPGSTDNPLVPDVMNQK